MTETSIPENEASNAPDPSNAMSVPAFRNLWLNTLTFFLVMNAHRFVVGWYVLDDEMGGLDGTEFQQSLAIFATGLPSLFLVLQAGAWSDRLDRRMLLVLSQVGSCIPLAIMATLTGVGSLAFGFVVALSLLTGVFTALGQPVRSALLPALVDKEQLMGAIAWNALAITASLILGPAVAQIIGTIAGFTVTFAVMAVVLAIGIIPALAVDVPPRESTPARRALLAEIREAASHVVRDPSLRVLFALLTMSSLTVNPSVMVLLQAFIKDDLGRSAGDAGIPMMLMGVGIAISSVIVMRKGNMARKGALFQRALMTGSTMTFLMGRSTDYWQLLVLTLVMGLAGGFYINMNQGLIQGNTPPELMGRVMGLFMLIQSGIFPFGALLLGAIASQVGVGNTISGAAGLSLIIVTLTYTTQRHIHDLA